MLLLWPSLLKTILAIIVSVCSMSYTPEKLPEKPHDHILRVQEISYYLCLLKRVFVNSN